MKVKLLKKLRKEASKFIKLKYINTYDDPLYCVIVCTNSAYLDRLCREVNYMHSASYIAAVNYVHEIRNRYIKHRANEYKAIRINKNLSKL
jgi:hypothetical protein